MRRTLITGTGGAATGALALITLVCAFVAVAVPRASLGYRTDVLQRVFHGASAAQRSVVADGQTSGGGRLTAPELQFTGSRLAAALRRDGLPLAAPRTQWSALAAGSAVFSGFRWQAYGRELGPPTLELLYSSALASQTELAGGSYPSSVRQYGATATFQIAVTAATAARLGLHTGSLLHCDHQAFVVSGIVKPRGTATAFWQLNSTAARPLLTYLTPQSTPYLSATAFVGPDEIEALQTALADLPVRVLWDFPLALAGLDADHAARLAQAQQRILSLPVAGEVSAHLTQTAENQSPLVIGLSSGLLAPLQAFVATDDAVQRALSLLFVSLAAIAAVVLLLGAKLISEHRRAEFSLMRARGAALWQVGRTALTGSVAVVLPAAALAVAGATAVTPGPGSSLAWWLAGVITVTALAGPPLLAMWSLRRRRAARLADPTARQRLALIRRWVIDGTLIGGAVGGLVILRQQGLPPPGSVDVFTSAAPVLAAIPVAVLVMRCYPLLLRHLARLARRRPGVVMVVGFARSGAGAGVLPAFALILALAVTAFAAMARDAVASAASLASWQATGADAVVSVPAAKARATAATLPSVRRVPGVAAVTTVTVTTGQSGEGLPVSVVVVDPQRYAAFTAATRQPRFPAAALARPAGTGSPPAIPVLISPAARASLSGAVAGQGNSLIVAGRGLRLKIAGTLTGIAGVQAGSGFVVVPGWAVAGHQPPPNVIAVAGPRLDGAALARTVRGALPGARVLLRSRVLAAISRAPLPHGGFITFAQGAGAAAGFAMLVLALTLVLTARSRELTLARLTTMGLDAAQSRRIAVAETLPAILATAIGGAVCAVMLVPLVGPALDLAAFTGMPVRVPLHASPVALALTFAGLCALAALALGVQDRIARHRGTTQALRIGE